MKLLITKQFSLNNDNQTLIIYHLSLISDYQTLLIIIH